MGEIDTDPIKSVRASVSRFGEKCSQIKRRSISDDDSDKEKDFDVILQDLANCKVQLEAMDAAHKQALLDQDHYVKTADRLSTLLKTSEFEKDIYMNECNESRIRISELEYKIQEMACELTELESTRTDLLRVEKQLMAATDAKLEAMKQAELMETALGMEKSKMEDMVHHTNTLNETILYLRHSSMEAENAKAEVEKELNHVQEQLESKTIFNESLQSEIQRANELLDQERMNSDQVQCTELLESELTQLKLELSDSKEELEKTKTELEETRGRENVAEVEIALLKADLHKGRSKTAAAEAAELRAKGEKSAAYFALQQMAIETQEVKKENQRLQSERDEDIHFEDSNSDLHEITISMEEYEMLVKKTQPENGEETESLKKDLESALARVSEFRTRAEQAATRAEVAEQAKAALEEQVKRWKEQKQRRRAALAALRAESMSRSSRSFEFDDDNPNKTFMPLGKFLKMNL